MEGFEGLTSAFDIKEEEKFDKEVELVKNDIQTIENRKEIVKAQAKNPAVFQDEDFIRSELRTLIMSTRTVQYKVEQDIKIGCDNRKIEVYSKLIESIGKLYNSLLELNKSIFEARVKTGQVDIEDIGNNKISLSSEQLLDMINKASERSEMNAIEADFEVENENIPNRKDD